MIVRVLGSAAGGGVPQWNCACANCSAARAGNAPRRSQSSFAVSADGERWWLINVSPDVAQQIEACAALQPQGGRGTPIAGMLVTDANVDHVGGLAVLRQAGEHAFAVHSSATVRSIAVRQQAFAAFAEPPHRWEAHAPGDAFDLGDGLHARVIPVDGLTPGYAGRRALPDAVVAFAIEDEAGGTALFAPVFASVTPALVEAARAADVAFFDGSFWSDDELAGVGVEKPARALGHAPAGGEGGSLATLSAALGTSGRRFYAHLNNTNPALDPASGEAAELARNGFGLAEDGLELHV